MSKSQKKIVLITLFSLVFLISAVPVLAAGSVNLPNPLGTGENATDPRAIVGNVIRAIFGLVGSIALAVFILGGFTWVISAGNEEKVTKGKNMILWAAFGLVVVFAAYALVSFVLNALTGQNTTGDTTTQPIDDTTTQG